MLSRLAVTSRVAIRLRGAAGSGRSVGALASRRAPQWHLAAGRQWMNKSTIALDGGGAALSTGGAAAVARSLPTAAQQRAVGWWLGGCTGMVFGMVVLGGVTRLTRSGLSMVDWRPQGRLPPMNDAEWQVEFDKYKAFPEYSAVNSAMTLEEFKPIYYMEWGHRMWGRGLGFVFALPCAYFMARGFIPRHLYPRMALMFSMGGAQGLVGWWMVKSGLEHSHVLGFERSEHDTPRVSPYRLAAHLTMAFATYSVLAWTAMDMLQAGNKPLLASRVAALTDQARPAVQTALKGLRRNAVVAAALVGTTLVSGAFVAGNDAGRAYNDWPLYAERVIPEEIWDDRFKPAFRNLFENTATVQFDHRNLAYATAGAVGALVARAHMNPALWAVIGPRAQLAIRCLGLGVAGQITLGIVTLINYVPVELGAAHQAGALTVWTISLWSLHALRMGTVAAAAAPAAGAAALAAGGVASAAAVAATAASVIAAGSDASTA